MNAPCATKVDQFSAANIRDDALVTHDPKRKWGPVFRSKSGDGEKWKLSVAVLSGPTDRLVIGCW
jgi:hypothetical protein